MTIPASPITAAEYAHVKRSAAALRDVAEQALPFFLDRLYTLAPSARRLMPTPDAERRKFNAMLANLGSGRAFEDWEFMVAKLGQRHDGYGVDPGQVLPLGNALLATAERHDPACTPATLAAWEAVLGEYFRVLLRALRQAAERREGQAVATPGVGQGDEPQVEQGADARPLIELIGGEAVVTAVHRRFYEVLFEDPWIGIFFYGKSIDSLVLKQTKFMLAAFGGANEYRWEAPDVAHAHMYVTAEQADVREVVLRNAIRAQGLSQEIEDRWLATDQSFRPAIVKEQLDECRMRVPGQVPVQARKPAGYAAPVLQSRDAAR